MVKLINGKQGRARKIGENYNQMTGKPHAMRMGQTARYDKWRFLPCRFCQLRHFAGPFGLTDPPRTNFTILPVNGFSIYRLYRFRAPSVFAFTISCALLVLPFCQFYHLSLVSFLPFRMDIRLCRCTILPFPLCPMPVLPFYQFPSIGRLVARVILVSLFILATSAIPPRRPVQVPLGTLACTVILSTEVLQANLVSQRIHVVIASRRRYLIDRYSQLAPGPIPLPPLGFPTGRIRRQFREDRIG